MTTQDKNINQTELKKQIQSWSDELGFNKTGISHIDLQSAEFDSTSGYSRNTMAPCSIWKNTGLNARDLMNCCQVR